MARQRLAEKPAAFELTELCKAANRPAVDQDLRHRPAACEIEQQSSEGRVVVQRNLLVREAARAEESPRARLQ